MVSYRRVSEDTFEHCICGAEMEYEECDDCEGDGAIVGYHGDPITHSFVQQVIPCDQCGGLGGWWNCLDRPRHHAYVTSEYAKR